MRDVVQVVFLANKDVLIVPYHVTKLRLLRPTCLLVLCYCPVEPFSVTAATISFEAG